MQLPPAALISLSISSLALVIALKNYRRKTGTYIRGNITTASGRACNDTYVSEVVLENLKDRAITIFSIYLRLGLNYYVELEDLEASPLVLKPFETYRKEFGPIEFYGINGNKIILNELFSGAKAKNRLVLSTSEGKYKVPSSMRRWSPIGDFFRNHLTAVIKPVQSVYKNKYIGANVAYVVEIFGQNGDDEIVRLQLRDFELKVFRKFSLTQEALSSKENLEALL